MKGQNCYLVSELLHYCNISVPFCEGIEQSVIDYYDFTYVTQGSMVYIANGERMTVRKNDAIFLAPGTQRQRLTGSEPVSYVSFNFRVYPDVSLPFSPFLKGCISPDTRKLFSIFAQNHLSPKFHSEEKCVNLLNYILFELLDADHLRSHNEHVRGILLYIEENFTAPISLRAVAQRAGLTPEYTAAIFKREVGKTLTEYVNEKRLLLARNLIADPKRSLGDVATEVGFENYHYFSRLFTRFFNISPLQWRKRSTQR